MNGVLIGIGLAFSLWCFYEAVMVYRWERKMQRMDKICRGMRWSRVNGVKPLFWEQR